MVDDAPLSRYLGVFAHTPEERVLRLLVQLGVDIVNADEGSLLVLDEERRELVFAMTIGSSGSEAALIGQRVPIGKGVTGLAALSLEVQIGAPVFKDVLQAYHAPQDGPASVIAAPMLAHDTLVGVLTAVSFRSELRFGGRDAKIYAAFGSIAGIIIEQRRRLARLEAYDASPDTAAPLGKRERDEQAVVDSLRRILTTQPDRLTHVVSLLANVERLVERSSSNEDHAKS